MKSSLGSPTKKQIRRFQMAQSVGCICSHIMGLGYNDCEIHHILSGGRRISHDHTICMSAWHHRGIVPSGFTEKEVKEVMGPSMAKNPKEFEEVFGTQMELLEFQNEAIKIVEESFV